MRIRSTKPEFWDAVADIDWVLVYDGPMPASVNAVAPSSGPSEYVYMLFDDGDSLVYVGRSFRPADRFTKHRRKPWWTSVTALVIVRVAEARAFGAHTWPASGPNTRRFEGLAIEYHTPPANAVRPLRGVVA